MTFTKGRIAGDGGGGDDVVTGEARNARYVGRYCGMARGGRRTYVRTVCPVFETKSSSNPRPFDLAATTRLPNALRTDDDRPCDVRRVHPRAIFARAARTCRARERKEEDKKDSLDQDYRESSILR